MAQRRSRNGAVGCRKTFSSFTYVKYLTFLEPRHFIILLFLHEVLVGV